MPRGTFSSERDILFQHRPTNGQDGNVADSRIGVGDIVDYGCEWGDGSVRYLLGVK